MGDRKLDRFFSWGRYLHWSNIHFRQYFDGQEQAVMKDNPIREKIRKFTFSKNYCR